MPEERAAGRRPDDGLTTGERAAGGRPAAAGRAAAEPADDRDAHRPGTDRPVTARPGAASPAAGRAGSAADRHAADRLGADSQRGLGPGRGALDSGRSGRDRGPELVTFGELLIDFVPTVTGTSLLDAPAFVKAAGGATANVAVGAARLGVRAGFMGKVGDDAFGRFLERELRDSGVDTRAVRFTPEARTSLAFVSLRADGEREFIFYRERDRDMLLDFRPDEVDTEYLAGARFFHFGSISLVAEPSRSATRVAVDAARAAGVTVSYDPNLRLNVWPGAEEARAGLLLGWREAGIVKASEEDMVFLTGGSADLDAAVGRLWHAELRLLVVTLGKKGCRYFTPGFRGDVAGFDVAAVDTTGAGDGFMAGLLSGLIKQPGAVDDEPRLREICRYANAVGALTTTERGAIPALPGEAQVEALLGV